MSLRRLLLPGLVLGVLMRAVALPLPGTRDLTIWKVWSFGAMHDLTSVYGVGGSPPERRVLHWQGEDMTVDYPPVAVAELAAAGQLYSHARPLFDDSSALNAVVKLPGLVADAAFVIAALTWGRRRFGADASAAAALFFWLNPALILDGPVLGYLDSQMAVPAAGALVLAMAGPAWLCGALMAVAVLTKAQAVFVVPVVAAAVLFARRPVIDAAVSAAAAAIVSAVVLLPYVLRGAWTNLVQAVGRLATHDMLSANAANVWWIVTWWLRVRDVWAEWGWRRALTQQIRILAISRATALGWPNARVVGLALVAVACAWAVWRMRHVRTVGHAAALAGWCAYAYALLAAQVHENHLALAVPFFCIAAALEPRYRAVLAWLSAIVTLNLVLFYGFGREMPDVFDRGWTGIDASVLLALVNVGVFVWTASRLARAEPRAQLA